MEPKYRQLAGCGVLSCPAVYQKREQIAGCGLGACPGVYKEDNFYLIVGDKIQNIPEELQPRVAEHEAMVRVPKEIISELVKKLSEERN